MAETKVGRKRGAKDVRLNFRIRESEDELIREAAAVTGESVTDYVTRSAVEHAHSVLADQRRFVLDAERWDEFVAAFSGEPKVIPAIQRLFAQEAE